MKKQFTNKARYLGLKLTAIIFALLLFVSGQSWGQINITSSSAVTQNFDVIGSSATASLPANWKMSAAGATSSWSTAGNVTATTQQASSGNPTSGGRYNWGTSTSERAIGFMTSGSYASPNTILAWYNNTSGSQINDLTITFDIERYRVNTAAFSLTFFTSSDGSTWTSRSDGDIATGIFATGASSYDFTAATKVTKTVTLTGINIANNSNFYIRWVFNTVGGNSQGVGLDNVSLTATLAPVSNTPTITVAPSTLTGFTYEAGSGPSTEKTFTVSGANLTSDISIAATTNYEISTASGGSFVATSPVTLTQTGGSVSNTTIYVRLKSGLSAANYNSEVINITSTGATTKTVTCSGSVEALSTLPYNETFADCGTQKWTSVSIASTTDWTCGTGYQQINGFGGGVASNDYLVSPIFNLDNYNYEYISFDSYTQYADATHPKIELLYTTNYTGNPSTTTWTTLAPIWPAANSQTWTGSGKVNLAGISGTNVRFAFHYTSTGVGSGTTSLWRIDNIVINEAYPTISSPTPTTLSGFTNITGTASTSQTFTIGGSNLIANLVVTAPSDYEVRENGTGSFGSSVSFAPSSGTVATKTIEVRIAASAGVGTPSGNVVCSSTSATSQNVAVSGTVNPFTSPTITLTGTLNAFSNTVINTTSSEQSYTLLGANLTSDITVTPPAGFQISKTSGSGFVSNPNTLTFTPAEVATAQNIYVRFAPTSAQAYSGNITHTATGAIQQNQAISGTGISAEPSNHATTFEAVLNTPTISNIILSWDDATGGQLPDGYLIKGSNVAYSSITDPVDGTVEADGGLIKNIAQGGQIHEFTGLSSGTTYYFKIYPYTNSGTSINYKTDGSVPQLSIATDVAVTTPVATAASDITKNSFTANWNSAVGATSYRLDVSSVSSGNMTDLIISEYVEGSSNNKYIEIYNGTGADVDLTNYKLQLFPNGGVTPSNDVTLSGTLINGSVIVYKNSSATIYSGTATNNTALAYNGDDAIALYKISTSSYVDIIGRIGEDPGTAWTSGSYTTLDKTLVRKSTVTGGVTTNPVSGFPTLANEWDQYNIDNVSNLGSHTSSVSTLIPSYTNLTVSATSQSITGLNANANYKYVVRGYGANGASSNSNEISVTTNKETESISSNTNWTSLSNVGSGTDVTIANGVELTLNTTAQCNNLTVQNGGKLTINNGSTLTPTGTFTIEDGGTLIDNTAAQSTLSGKMKRNVVAANWSATDKSGYHLIASPNTNQAIIDNWISGNYDFYAYDEVTNMWLNQKVVANNLNTFTPGKGYLVAYETAINKEFNGIFKNVDVAVNLSKTASKGEGWNLLGNPYPSNLTWNTGWTLTNVEGVAKVWKENLKAYIDVNPGEVIPANQGFWVKANAAVTGFVIPAAARTHTTQAYNKTSQNEKLSLTVTTTANTTQAVTNIIINDLATYGYDMQLEGTNLYGGTVSPNLYSVLNDGHKLSTNAIPTPTNSTVVNLGFNAYVNGNYTITANNGITNCSAITLEDLKTNTTQNLLQNPVYNFTAATTDNANRFVLHFATAVGVNEIGNSNGSIYAYDNNIYINASEQIKQISVYNTLGQLVKTLNNVNGLQKINMNGNATGYYIVKVVSDKNVYSEKVLIK